LDIAIPLDYGGLMFAAPTQRCAGGGEFVDERAEHEPRIIRTLFRINGQFLIEHLGPWFQGSRIKISRDSDGTY